MIKITSFLMSAIFVYLSFAPVFASGNDDQVVLKNGDRLTGKIVKKEADKIVLQTENLGELTILTATIEKITTVEKIAEKEAVKETKNVEIVEAEYQKPEVKTESETETIEPLKNPRQTAGFRDGWEGSADVGFSFTSGNANTTTLAAGIRGAKVRENDKLSAYLNSLVNRSKVGSVSTTTSNAQWGGFRYDRNLNKKVFAFGSFDFERDKPQKLNLRTVLGAGLGYHAIKNEKTTLDLFSGLAYNREWFAGAPNRNSLEVLFGDEFKHKLNERTNITQRLVIYPSITNTGEFRGVFDASINTNLTKKIGMFVTVGDRYNSSPVLGAKSNDFFLSTGLRFAFGKTK